MSKEVNLGPALCFGSEETVVYATGGVSDTSAGRVTRLATPHTSLELEQ